MGSTKRPHYQRECCPPVKRPFLVTLADQHIDVLLPDLIVAFIPGHGICPAFRLHYDREK